MIWLAAVGLLAGALAGAWGLPALGMSRIWPSIEGVGFSVTNYRGIRVAPALWIAWLFWALALAVMHFGLYFFPVGISGAAEPVGIWRGLAAVLSLQPAIGVCLAAMAFGVIDDVWGGPGDKGFRGHASSLASGRLTTGGLKALGIGVVAFLAATYTTLTNGMSLEGRTTLPVGYIATTVLLGTLVIALSANLLNLLDLRPGRALKGSLVMLVPASLSVAVLCATDRVGAGGTLFAVLLAIAILAGPILAAWPFDLGERGMLGDAGSNALGALLGFVVFAGLAPAASSGSGAALAGLGVFATLLLLLNAASERVSFSQLIAGNRVLRRLDDAGRAHRERQGSLDQPGEEVGEGLG